MVHGWWFDVGRRFLHLEIAFTKWKEEGGGCM
jgi:hypothetical protein